LNNKFWQRVRSKNGHHMTISLDHIHTQHLESIHSGIKDIFESCCVFKGS